MGSQVIFLRSASPFSQGPGILRSKRQRGLVPPGYTTQVVWFDTQRILSALTRPFCHSWDTSFCFPRIVFWNCESVIRGTLPHDDKLPPVGSPDLVFLCAIFELCVSVVITFGKYAHRVTEYTEGAQRISNLGCYPRRQTLDQTRLLS